MASEDDTPENTTDSDEELSIDLSYIGSREDSADGRTVASRQRLRDQLNEEIQMFLAKGGKIDQVGTNVTADPPKRPVSNYGQQPL